jgi:hypothetical protein
MSEKRYTKVEEEILQILDKMDVQDERPARPPLRIVRSPARTSRINGLRAVWRSPWLSLALTAAFAFLALMVKGDSHLLATVLASCSILAFLSPIVLHRPGGGANLPQRQEPKLWRGRDITLTPAKPETPGERFRRWRDRRRDGLR